MRENLARKLLGALAKIDRPGSFCTSGSVPAVLPGLEVEGMGPVGLPLTPARAEELKKNCEQAPYGKGEETLVDTSVRRVWRLTPDRFALTNPDWQAFLRETVGKVQEGLGLEGQKLESHLYDLLLYEPGSFFLPHKDGEKLDRMVATLVVVLPSAFEGGELVVRHEGEEQVVDFGGRDSQFRIHFAAFYADCEHEIRPLREGYRLCLVYNLTLAKSKKAIGAPRHSEHIGTVSEILRQWAADEEAGKVAVTLEHEYTKDGIAWDTLKGADRAKAKVLAEAARRAGCQAYLGLLTFHESGSAEYAGGGYGGGYYRRRGWYDDEDEDEGDASDYEMGEVYDSSLTMEGLTASDGKRLPIDSLSFDREEEILDPEALEGGNVEEEFEGYTGNAGMTLDRWYRHAAVVLWPDRLHFDVLCEVGSRNAVPALNSLVTQWKRASRQDAPTLRAQCLEFAGKILANWRENPYGSSRLEEEPGDVMKALRELDDPRLIGSFLGTVLPKDASVDPGTSLAAVCQKHGWPTFRPELEAVFKATTRGSLGRNLRVLERLCLAKPRKKEGWLELCAALAGSLLQAVETIDRGRSPTGYYGEQVGGAELLSGLARALLATGQEEQLARLVTHALGKPKQYPLTEAHIKALLALRPWLQKNVKQPSPALARWVAAIREQLEALTAKAPEAPADFRRPAKLSCSCADCRELSEFLADRREEVHRFRVAQGRRDHLENTIRNDRCDVSCKTERTGSPYTLVCTKTTRSYQESVRKYEQDQEHLVAVRAIEDALPG
jgi:hypothetical protein